MFVTEAGALADVAADGADEAGRGLERGGGFALWRQIARTLEEEIARGDHAPGARLPTEADLAARFGVNRHTLRRAVAELAARALVRVEQGRGTFVQENVIDYAVGRRTRFSENVARVGGAPGGRLLRAATMPAPAPVAAALDLKPGRPVTLIERVGEVDGRPVNIGLHYFCAERFPAMIDSYRATQSITASLARLGVADYVRRVTRVTARMPSQDEAHILQQPATRPLLQTESINTDTDGSPVEYGICRFAGDRMQLVFEP